MLRVRSIPWLLALVVLAACRVVPAQQSTLTPVSPSPQVASVPTAALATPAASASASALGSAASASSSAASSPSPTSVKPSPSSVKSSPSASDDAALRSSDALTGTDTVTTSLPSMLVFVPMTQSAAPTETPVSPTNAPEPPTETPISPTDTPLLPTDTPAAPSELPIDEPTSSPGDDAELPIDEPTPSPGDDAVPPPIDEPAPVPTDEPAPVPTDVLAPPSDEPTSSPSTASPASSEGSLARGTITSRPWAVMIDNYPDAWPQSGLNNASLVFEALAEGGITRFMAVFADGAQPDVSEIGPVRSARVYFVQWAMGLNAVFMHAGGSPDGLELARSTDQIVNAEALELPQYVRRDNSRAAPHNLYTSSESLRALAAEQAPLDEPQIGYLFDQIAPAETPQATTISYDFTEPLVGATWRYDAETNAYYRSANGEPQVERTTNAPLRTSNLVVMEVPAALRVGDAAGRIDLEVIGSGAARVFVAAQQIDATWRKDDAGAPLRFFNAQGEEIVFNAGSMWVAAVSSLDKLTVE